MPDLAADDRGAAVREVPLRVGACPDPQAEAVRVAIARLRARSAVSWRWRYVQTVALLGTLVAAVASTRFVDLGLEALLGRELQGPRQILVFLVIAAIPLSLVLLLSRPYWHWWRVARRNVLLGLGRCPACGFAIGLNRTPSDDGCLVCSECGAAWRAERVAPVVVDEAPAWGASRLNARLRSASQHSSVMRDDLGRRVAPIASVRLPVHGPWGTVQRLRFTIGGLCVAGVVYAMSLVVVAVSVFLIGRTIERPPPDWLGGPGVQIMLAMSFATLAISAIGVLPAACAAHAVAAMRLIELLRARLCPCCEATIAPPDEPDGPGRCRGCGAAWAQRWQRSGPSSEKAS